MKSGVMAEVSGEELLMIRFLGTMMSVVKAEFQANFGKRNIFDFTLGKCIDLCKR